MLTSQMGIVAPNEDIHMKNSIFKTQNCGYRRSVNKAYGLLIVV